MADLIHPRPFTPAQESRFASQQARRVSRVDAGVMVVLAVVAAIIVAAAIVHFAAGMQ